MSEQQNICCICTFHEDDIPFLPTTCSMHYFCGDDLRRAVKLAIQDEKMYPVSCRCEGTIMQDHVIEDELRGGTTEDKELLEQYQEIVAQYKIPHKLRTYCANNDCCLAQGQSRFLNYEVFGQDNKAICPDCDSITCLCCKRTVLEDVEHECDTDTYDEAIKHYVDSLPTDERWKCQKCYLCRAWIEKSTACNHMECACGAQFCLICGQPWRGLVTCPHGCPKDGPPVYDEENYNQHGFHKVTGLYRAGNPWDGNDYHGGEFYQPDVEDEDYPDHYEEEDDQGSVYGEDGFNQGDRDRDGYDRAGFDIWGYNREQRDADGFDVSGKDIGGFFKDGFNVEDRDREGFSREGYDLAGFDRNDLSSQLIHRSDYLDDGYDRSNDRDVLGFDRSGLDKDKRDSLGFSVSGFDVDGLDRSGWSAEDFDRFGYNRYGLNAEGLRYNAHTQHHRNLAGELQPGWYTGPDGNAHAMTREPPAVDVGLCRHTTRYVAGSGDCLKCGWNAPWFRYNCSLCNADFCRACNNWWSLDLLFGSFPFFSGEDFGLGLLFGDGKNTDDAEDMNTSGHTKPSDTAGTVQDTSVNQNMPAVEGASNIANVGTTDNATTTGNVRTAGEESVAASSPMSTDWDDHEDPYPGAPNGFW